MEITFIWIEQSLDVLHFDTVKNPFAKTMLPTFSTAPEIIETNEKLNNNQENKAQILPGS